MGEAAAAKGCADWISVSELASERGVTHQAISKRVRTLSRRGKLPTRREGKTLLIHRATFDALAAATHDPAQDLRNRGRERDAASSGDLAGDASAAVVSLVARAGDGRAGYGDAVAREKNARAALAEMELARRRAELVPARDLEAATVAVGTALAQRLAALKALAGKLYAASKGGEEALAVALGREVDAVVLAICQDMKKLAVDGAAEPATPRQN